MCPLTRKVITAVLLIIAVCGAQAAEPRKTTPAPAAAKSLDLKAPDIRTLFSERQIQAWVNPPLPEVIEEVEVQRRRPSRLGTIMALFMPYSSPTFASVKRYPAADSTMPYLPAVTAPARMAGEPVPYNR